MNQLDLSFSIVGQKPIPADHGYALYGALSRILPEVHRENGIAIHPIRGRQIGNRQLILSEHSRLVLRVPDGQISPLLKLAGKSIQLADASLRIGVPQVRALIPAPTLRSRLVIIKVAHIEPPHMLTLDQFTAALRTQLDKLGVSHEASIVIPPKPNGDPRRRTLRIKQQEIVGYEVIIEGLTGEESLAIQEQGLGGRRHMGCGVFVPVR